MKKLFIELCYQPFPMESIIAFIAIIISAGTIGILWKYKKSAEVVYLILIELFATIWALFSGLEFMADSLEMKMFWSQLSYFGIAFLPVSYFLFTAAFSQKFHIITASNVTLLSIIPFITIPVALTNEHHNLLWQSVTQNTVNFNTIMIEHGVWFWIYWSYAITLIIAGLYNLFQSIYKFTAYYKSQVSTLLIATLIPLFGNLIYITGFNPIPGMDWTPILFAFSGLAITFGIIRYRMFDLVPFARNSLIDTMTDGVIIVNSEGFIEDYNPAVNAIFKFDKPVIRNRFASVFSKHENLIKAIGTNDRTFIEVESEQYGTKSYQVQFSPVFNRNSQFSGYLIQINDITSLKETENKLKLVNKKLEAEVEERGRLIEDLDAFAHTVAHDLKNSLGSVYHLSEIIEECIEDGNIELLKEFSGHIKSSSGKAMHITHELLLLATVNHHEVENSPLEMGQIFLSAKNQVNGLIKETNAKISFPDRWPASLGYAPWVEEIWANYLSNALKYGGNPPVIHAGADASEHYVRFWIRDNGNGISPADQKKLFRKYSRLTPEKAEGYGLGLSIVKRIARKLGGYVGVESTGIQGEGACFWFELPVTHIDMRACQYNEN